MRRRVVRGLSRAFVAGAVWAITPVAATAQVAVDALELALPLRGSAGSPAAQTFSVTNSGDAGTQVTISAQDWDRSETGENRYSPLGTLPTSCGTKVSVFPAVLYLEPKETARIRVHLDSASALDHACNTILFVETPKPPASKSTTSIRYSVRYGVKVYVEPDAPPSAEIVEAEAVPASTSSGKDSVAVSVMFSNTGARQSITRGVAEIRRPDNTVVQTIAIPDFPTLPGAKRRVTVGLPLLPRGSYVVLVILDYGGAEVIAGQMVVDVR